MQIPGKNRLIGTDSEKHSRGASALAKVHDHSPAMQICLDAGEEATVG
jgi:hypothetical protein